jgi:hypothetical protein
MDQLKAAQQVDKTLRVGDVDQYMQSTTVGVQYLRNIWWKFDADYRRFEEARKSYCENQGETGSTCCITGAVDESGQRL